MADAGDAVESLERELADVRSGASELNRALEDVVTVLPGLARRIEAR